MKNSDTNTNVVSGATPGVMLKENRERLGMTVVDVASRLCLSVQLVEAIERDDYSQMSARVYARGHIVSYAHLLHIPEADILRTLDNVHMEFAPPKNPIPTGEQRTIPIYQSSETSQQHSGLVLWGSILVLMIVIGLVMLWWKGPTSMTDNKTLNPAASNTTEIPLKPDPSQTVTPSMTPTPGAPANPGATRPNSTSGSGSNSGTVVAPAQQAQPNNALPGPTGLQNQPDANQIAAVTLPPPSDSEDNY